VVQIRNVKSVRDNFDEIIPILNARELHGIIPQAEADKGHITRCTSTEESRTFRLAFGEHLELETHMKLTLLASIGVAVILSTGCGSKSLTRGKAAELIKKAEFTGDALKSKQQEYTLTLESDHWVINPSQEKENLNGLVASGYVNADFHRCAHQGAGFGEAICLQTTLTDKGRQASASWKKLPFGDAWTLITSTGEFGEVTGITMGTPTDATVQYTWRQVLTDEGKALGMPAPQWNQASAELKLFDDGWRAR
jgi:hypothetical protein